MNPHPLTVTFLSSNHACLKPFKTVPWARKRLAVLALIPIAVFIAIMMLALVPISFNPEWNRNWVGGVIFLWLFLVGATVALWLAWRLAIGEMARQCLEDAANLGEPGKRERYVGVSYAATLALLQTGAADMDSAMDRGWIRWEDQHLCFRGYGPCFRLPAALIDAVEVVPTRSWISAWLPRVVVRWRHPTGTSEHLCLEARVARSRHELKAEMERLCEWLEEGRSQMPCKSLVPSESDLPLRSTATEQAIAFRSGWTRAADHLEASLRTALMLACALALAALLDAAFHSHLGHNVAALAGGIWPAWYFGVLLVCQQRRRAQEKAPKADHVDETPPAGELEESDKK